MLAAILIPILLLLAAVALERFEARVLPSAPARRTRAQRPEAAAPAESAPDGPARHLHAVPAGEPVVAEAGTVPTGTTGPTDDVALRPAS